MVLSCVLIAVARHGYCWKKELASIGKRTVDKVKKNPHLLDFP